TPGTCATAATQASRILANWGSNTNVTENLQLTGSSPLRDSGTNSPLFGTVPASDYSDQSRPVDGDLNGSSITDIGGYEFRFPDTDGDGVPDINDCASLVNSAWAIPDQVPDPLKINAAQLLSWLHVPQANIYNVYRGTIIAPFAYNPTCLIAEVPGVST